MTLIEAKVGEEVVIQDFLAPFCDIRERICSMGLKKGDIVTIVANSFFSPILLETFEGRIAVSRTEAKKIRVKKF